MSAELWTQLGVAIIPSVLSGLLSFFVSSKSFKNEINKLKESNKHEIEKLMKQHQIDIESLKEKHKLEIESKEKEHDLKIEEMKVKNEQEMLMKEKELSNSILYPIIGKFAEGVVQDAISSPEVKSELKRKFQEGFNQSSYRDNNDIL